MFIMKKIINCLLILCICLFGLTACAGTTASMNGVNNYNSSSDDTEEENVISWEEAKSHIGEYITVVGDVKGTKYASESNGKPTFLDIGVDYPDPNRFTIVIWGNKRSNFTNAPETYYSGKTIEVYGEIVLYNGVAEIEVDSEDDISIVK